MAKWGEIKCREAASKCPRCAQQDDLVQAAVAVERWHCARVVERMAPYTPKQIAQMSGIDRFAKQRKITLSRMYHAAAAAIRKGGE